MKRFLLFAGLLIAWSLPTMAQNRTVHQMEGRKPAQIEGHFHIYAVDSTEAVDLDKSVGIRLDSTFAWILTQPDWETSDLYVVDSLKIPHGPTVTAADCDQADEAGKVFIDTDAVTGQQLYVCEGTAGWVLADAGDDLSDNTLTDLSDVAAKQGNGTSVQMFAGSASSADFACFDANGNVSGQAGACDGGGGTGDNVLVNDVAAVDAAFADSTGITWDLNTAPTGPDRVAARVDSLYGANLTADQSRLYMTAQTITLTTGPSPDEIDTDANIGNIFQVTLIADGGKLNNPTGIDGNQCFRWLVRQPAGGGQDLTFDTMFEDVPEEDQTASAVTEFAGCYDAVSGKIRLNGTVSTAEIANGAVYNEDLADGQILPVKMDSIHVQYQYWIPADTATTVTAGMRLVANTHNAWRLTDVEAFCLTPPTGGATTFTVKHRTITNSTLGSFVNTLSTNISIDDTEYSSEDAATPPVINTANDDIPDDAFLEVRVATVSTGGAGCAVTLSGYAEAW